MKYKPPINNIILFILYTIFLAVTTLCFVSGQVTFNDGVRREIIRLSNTYKCVHGQPNTNWYKYDRCIENYSQTHSNYMADNNSFAHSSNPYGDRTCFANNGFGENIAAGHRTPMSAINAFYIKELPNVNWDNPSDSSKGVVGHLTALIWKSNSRQGMACAYNANSSYKYYCTQNMAAPGGTGPNTSGRYVENVTPIDSNTNYTKCERDVYNYYNQYPEQYFDSASTKDGTTQISQVNINGEFGPTLTRGMTTTVSWTASASNTPFTVVLHDIGTNTHFVSATQAFVLAENVPGDQRSVVITIPDNIHISDFGALCVETADGTESSCMAGLKLRPNDGSDGGVTPTPTPTPTTTYAWRTADFGACHKQNQDQTCGPLIKTRKVECVDNNGAAADDAKCTEQKPPESEHCQQTAGDCLNGGQCDEKKLECSCVGNFTGTWCQTAPAANSWRAGEFSSCAKRIDSQVCGPLVKTRKVECVDKDNKVLDDAQCATTSTTKPTTTENCEEPAGDCLHGGECDPFTFQCDCAAGYTGTHCETPTTPTPTNTTTYHWKVGEFGDCHKRTADQVCGGMIKNRTISCVDQNGKEGDVMHCEQNGGEKPPESVICDGKDMACLHGGACDPTTWQCICPEAQGDVKYTGARCEKKETSNDHHNTCKTGTWGSKCQCKEIYATFPFNHPPTKDFKENAKGTYQTASAEQKEYFDKLRTIFAAISGLSPDRFYLTNWSTTKRAQVINITFAIRQECNEMDGGANNNNGTLQSGQNHNNNNNNNNSPTFNPPPSTVFRPFQIRAIAHKLHADENNNNKMKVAETENSNLYDIVNQITQELSNPDSEYASAVPKDETAAAANASAAPLPPDLNTQELIHDPACTANCPSGDKPQANAGKKKDNAKWIVLGVVLGVVFLLCVAGLVLFLVRRSMQSDDTAPATKKAGVEMETRRQPVEA